MEPAGVFLLQVVNECSAVLNEASVSPDPDLEDPTLAELVGAPEQKANAITVAKERKEAIAGCRIMVGSVREEADAVAVVSDGVIGELDQFVMTRVDPRFHDIQGIQGRRGGSDRFLGHLVAAIFGKDAVRRVRWSEV